ncbi:MAG: CoA ester lyase [Actinobacteria bacterium]|nr:CoA ester lyase [Actinomycetota bacterium]
MRPRRSVFYIPGNNPKLLGKAEGIRADVITLDLEDSVPMSEKPRARELTRAHLVPAGSSGAQVYCRINPWASGQTEVDLQAIVGPDLDGVCLPKADHPDEVVRLAEALSRLELERGVPEGSTQIQLLIETARGLMHCYDAAQASPRVEALLFGALDFARDMGVHPEPRAAVVAYPRAQVAVAARAARRTAIDSVFPGYQDPEGFEADTLLSRELGYEGRIVIHPAQLAPTHRLYAPSDEEIEWARQVVEVFEQVAMPQGLGAVPLEGTMVDIPVYEAARRLLCRRVDMDVRTEA